MTIFEGSISHFETMTHERHVRDSYHDRGEPWLGDEPTPCRPRGAPACLKPVRILEKADRLDWDYDGEADVLYVSIGKPRKARGVEIGQGVIVRYDEKRRQVVGLTIMGIRARLLELTPPARTGASPARPRRRGRAAPPRGRA